MFAGELLGRRQSNQHTLVRRQIAEEAEIAAGARRRSGGGGRRQPVRDDADLRGGEPPYDVAVADEGAGRDE